LTPLDDDNGVELLLGGADDPFANNGEYPPKQGGFDKLDVVGGVGTLSFSSSGDSNDDRVGKSIPLFDFVGDGVVLPAG
jgi:hypothetical protein